ncbi:MAG: hypothetical protein B6244_11900 [Candidatus Cloacimonetes bacterium 4572_55]|nr:MAG: hypothetical protein B6244_11900 [Candidatus Cloacimonetes bacterium 4572_55]
MQDFFSEESADYADYVSEESADYADYVSEESADYADYVYVKESEFMIDAHFHVNFQGYTLEKLIQYLDKNRIDLCWLMTWEEAKPSPWYYRHLPVEDVFAAYQRYPDRIIPMYAPDPRAPNSVGKFMDYHGKGIRGCAELKVPIRWDDPCLTPLLECVDSLGLPLVFHIEEAGRGYACDSDSRLDNFIGKSLRTERFLSISGKIIGSIGAIFPPLRRKIESLHYTFPGYMMDLEAFEKILNQYKNIRFVAHGPHFWRSIINGVTGQPSMTSVSCRLLSEYDRLFADLSAPNCHLALTKNPDFSRQFLTEFSGKLLYGTDNFSLGLREYLDNLRLSRAVYRSIYHDNAANLISV